MGLPQRTVCPHCESTKLSYPSAEAALWAIFCGILLWPILYVFGGAFGGDAGAYIGAAVGIALGGILAVAAVVTRGERVCDICGRSFKAARQARLSS